MLPKTKHLPEIEVFLYPTPRHYSYVMSQFYMYSELEIGFAKYPRLMFEHPEYRIQHQVRCAFEVRS